jgi:hypothetical protein
MSVNVERLALVKAVESKYGFTIKRSASSTGGLSCSNDDRRANGFAHLLCNQKNFPTVAWLLKDSTVIEIPEEFAEGFDFASFLYGCGTAPRIVRKGSKHVSKDAVKLGVSQAFVQWAQATRIAGVGGTAGLSRSVKEALQQDDAPTQESAYFVAYLPGTKLKRKQVRFGEEQKLAAQSQLDVVKLQQSGGITDFLIAGQVGGFADTLAGKMAARMAELMGTAKEAEAKPVPQVVPVKKSEVFVAYLPGSQQVPEAKKAPKRAPKVTAAKKAKAARG